MSHLTSLSVPSRQRPFPLPRPVSHINTHYLLEEYFSVHIYHISKLAGCMVSLKSTPIVTVTVAPASNDSKKRKSKRFKVVLIGLSHCEIQVEIIIFNKKTS